MLWSWGTFFATLLFVAFSGLVSYLEGTFTQYGPRKVVMGFANHGGMWSDFFILSVVNGFITPHLRRRARVILSAFSTSVIVTIFSHHFWHEDASRMGETLHIWPEYRGGNWLEELSVSGSMHVIYTAVQFALLLVYVYSSIPKETVWFVSFLLTVHAPLGTIQPALFCRGTVDEKSVIILAAQLILVWGVAIFKLGSAKER